MSLAFNWRCEWTHLIIAYWQHLIKQQVCGQSLLIGDLQSAICDGDRDSSDSTAYVQNGGRNLLFTPVVAKWMPASKRVKEWIAGECYGTIHYPKLNENARTPHCKAKTGWASSQLNNWCRFVNGFWGELKIFQIFPIAEREAETHVSCPCRKTVERIFATLNFSTTTTTTATTKNWTNCRQCELVSVLADWLTGRRLLTPSPRPSYSGALFDWMIEWQWQHTQTHKWRHAAAAALLPNPCYWVRPGLAWSKREKHNVA